MLVAALRRFTLLLAVLACGTALVSLLLGVASGADASRSVSVGFYLVGATLLIAGFFMGNRGPVRMKGDSGMPLFGGLFQTRMLRWATPEEREETLNMSVVLVALGFVLIILGVATDTRYSLF